MRGNKQQEVLEAHGDASSAEACVQLARAHREQGELTAAEEATRHGLTHHPANQALIAEHAEVASARKDWREAIARWQAVLQSYGDTAPPKAYIRLARAHRECGELTAAEEATRQGLSHHPAHGGLFVVHAEVATARKDSLEAAKRWQAVLKAHGDTAPAKAYVKLARAHRERGELAAAEEATRQGLTHYPADKVLVAEHAESASARKDWREAVTRWQQALQALGDAASDKAYAKLARAHRELGDITLAENVLVEGLDRHAHSLLLARDSAAIAMAREDWAEAVKRWALVLQLHGEECPPEYHALRCRALRLAGRVTDARAELRQALAHHPRNVRLLTEWALCGTGFEGCEPAGNMVVDVGEPQVEIVICVYNALDEVKICLRSLVDFTELPYFLTIIDDASAAHVSEFLDDFVAGKPGMRVITNAQNCGYTASANCGLRAARANWILLLNSDTVVTPGWLDGMMECALATPRVGAVGPLSNAAASQSVPEQRDADGRHIVNELPPGMTPDVAAQIVRNESERAFPQVPILNGFCILWNRAALEEVGYFDEVSFPVGYGEENDLCLRLVSASYQLAIADHVYVFHAKSASFGHERRRSLSNIGANALRAKWPDYDYTYIIDGIETLPSMGRLRERLRGDLGASDPSRIN